jgi:carbon monoxide dehydrogenase subunit G
MIREQADTHIDRPVDVVFAYITDIGRFPEWSTVVQEATITSSGPLAVGSTFRTTAHFLGRRFQTDNVVTVYDPPHTFAGKVTSGPVQYEVTTTLRAEDGGTNVTWAIEGEAAGFFRVAEPLLARLGRRQIEAQVGTLKDLLEAEDAAGAS